MTGGLLAAWFTRFDDGDAVAVPQKLQRAGGADDARADDGDVLAHAVFFRP